MPSGTHLTAEDRSRILKLLRMRHPDGDWVYGYKEVADRLGHHRETVYNVVREAAVRWGEHVAWKPDNS